MPIALPNNWEVFDGRHTAMGPRRFDQEPEAGSRGDSRRLDLRQDVQPKRVSSREPPSANADGRRSFFDADITGRCPCVARVALYRLHRRRRGAGGYAWNGTFAGCCIGWGGDTAIG